MVVDYFTKLFESNGGEHLENMLKHIKLRVTMDMNEELSQPLVDEEIKFALFQMHPTKAPGPYGMSSGFYKKHWDVVGTDICNAVRSMLHSGCML